MNRDQYGAHGLWATLDDFHDVISGDLSGKDDARRDSIRRLHSVSAYLGSLRGLDPALVDAPSLDQINSDLTQARDFVNSYLQDSDANATLLTSNADTSALAAFNGACRTLPLPSSDMAVKAAHESANRYKDGMDAEVAALRDQIADLKQQITESGEERAADAQKSSEALSDLQAKITEGEQQVATQTTQLQEQIETQRASFSEEAMQRADTFKASEKARDQETANDREAQNTEAAALISDLRAKREQAAALLKATSDDVISGDYREWATKQGKTASRWNTVAIMIGLLTVAALVWIVLGATNDSVQFLVSKSSVGVIGLIVAGYAARQATEHRAEERTANRLALDLAALDPFLENVSDPQIIRTEIAKRVFVPESRHDDAPRFSFRRRSMTLAELVDFVNVLRNPPSG